MRLLPQNLFLRDHQIKINKTKKWQIFSRYWQVIHPTSIDYFSGRSRNLIPGTLVSSNRRPIRWLHSSRFWSRIAATVKRSPWKMVLHFLPNIDSNTFVIDTPLISVDDLLELIEIYDFTFLREKCAHILICYSHNTLFNLRIADKHGLADVEVKI